MEVIIAIAVIGVLSVLIFGGKTKKPVQKESKPEKLVRLINEFLKD